MYIVVFVAELFIKVSIEKYTALTPRTKKHKIPINVKKIAMFVFFLRFPFYPIHTVPFVIQVPLYLI